MDVHAMISKLPSWTALAISLLLLSNANAATGERTITSLSQFATTNLGSYAVIHVESYNLGEANGGGDYIQAPCTPTAGLCYADSAGHTFRHRFDAGGGAQSTIAAPTITLTNADCGSFVKGSAAGKSVVVFPALPAAGCEFKVSPALFDIRMDFNGNSAFLPGYGSHALTQLVLPYYRENGFVTFVYSATDGIWHGDASSRLTYEAMVPLDDQLLTNGQVRFDYDGSTFLTLTPQGGPGGLIVDAQMHSIASSGLKLNKSGTTSSALNYFYVTNTGANTVTGTSSDAGVIQIALTTALTGAVVGDQVHAICYSIGGTVEANGAWNATITTDVSHIDLIGSTFTNAWTSGGVCRVDYMLASSVSHAPIAGVETNSGVIGAFGAGKLTFVGEVYVEATHAVNDTTAAREVASWYNQKIKTCKNHFTTDRTTTSTSYTEVNSEIQCPFVTFGINDLQWGISGGAKNLTVLDGMGISAGFDTTSSAEVEEVSNTNDASSFLQVSGSKGGLSEGKHFITLLGKVVTGGTETVYGTSPVTYAEVRVPQ